MATPVGCVRSLRFLIGSFPPGAVEACVVSPRGLADDEFRAVGARLIPIPAISLFQNIAGLPVRGVRWGTTLRAFWQMRHGGVLRHALRSFRPDLLHLNEHGMYQAAYLGRQAGVPVIMHVRCVADRESRWQGALLRSCARRFIDRVVAIDESVRWSIREVPFCRVVYNPAGGPATPPVDRPFGGPVRVSYLAGLESFKGVADLLEAARLLRDHKNIVFHLYGKNRWSDDFYRSPVGRMSSALGITPDIEGELRARIERDRLADTVLLMGYVRAEEALTRETDLVVFPSRLNGVGRSVFEAGMLGIPSVVTLKDRIQDIVEDGVTGLIVPERDPKALAAAIARLAEDPQLRRTLGRNARKKYAVQFDPSSIGLKMLDLYREVLARPRPGRCPPQPRSALLNAEITRS
jgi:glycosyltransferase involved in cell wall biosynthesis